MEVRQTNKQTHAPHRTEITQQLPLLVSNNNINKNSFARLFSLYLFERFLFKTLPKRISEIICLFLFVKFDLLVSLSLSLCGCGCVCIRALNRRESRAYTASASDFAKMRKFVSTFCSFFFSPIIVIFVLPFSPFVGCWLVG